LPGGDSQPLVPPTSSLKSWCPAKVFSPPTTRTPSKSPSLSVPPVQLQWRSFALRFLLDRAVLLSPTNVDRLLEEIVAWVHPRPIKLPGFPFRLLSFQMPEHSPRHRLGLKPKNFNPTDFSAPHFRIPRPSCTATPGCFGESR